MNRNYISPSIEFISINIEKGFAQSIGGNISDFTPGADDSLDD